MNDISASEICCPQFKPEPWDDKIVDWNNKKFIKDKVFTIFYIPLNFDTAMNRLTNKADKANANTSTELCLSEHTSLWNTNVYFAVDKEIKDADNVALSGKYLSKVFEGDFKDTGKWYKDFEQFAKNKRMNLKKTYSWHTTCPKCAKKYEKNYIVLLGQI